MKQKRLNTLIKAATRFLAKHYQRTKRSLFFRPKKKSLPRPLPTNFLSNRLRPLFETVSIKTFFGANLALAFIAVPLIDLSYHPKFEVNLPPTTTVLSSPEDPVIVTTQTQFTLPVTPIVRISQRFHSGHPAYDLNTSVGTKVVSFSPGRIYQVQDTQYGYGKYVVINHGSGLASLYAHLDKTTVKPGQLIKAGDQLGEVGLTGYTTGPHLHFEIRDNGRAVNPSTYLDL